MPARLAPAQPRSHVDAKHRGVKPEQRSYIWRRRELCQVIKRCPSAPQQPERRVHERGLFRRDRLRHELVAHRHGSADADPDDLVFPTSNGTAVTRTTLLLAIGRDPAYVMSQLGHADAAFTFRVYAPAMRRDEARSSV
ncbi:MAG: hypothetical protein ACR2MB_15955 [Acidimicrobiales bacterium]